VEPPHDPIASWSSARVAAGVMPGATWWVANATGVVSRGAVGEAARVPRSEPAREDMPYDLASLTKPLCTALVAALLEQDGVLALDAPSAALLGELAGTPYGSASLLDLGSHRARLPAWIPLYLGASTLEQYVARIAAVAPLRPPGEEVYSDLGFILLGAAIERAAGSTLARLFEERVVRPLGLTSIGFCTAGHSFRGAAPTERGNVYERRRAGEAGTAFAWRTEVIRGAVHDVNAHTLGGVAGHAGLFGTAFDVAAVARAILSGEGLGLDARARRRLLLPATVGGCRTFGLVLAGGSDAARGVLSDACPGHTGFTGTSLWLDPVRGETYVLLTNRVHPEVREHDFQSERRAFHRVARGMTGAADPLSLQ
jgi:CubicO group peptidase (beta-lactamase class C family)